MILENKVHLKKFLLMSLIPIIVFLIIGNIFFFYQYQSYIQNYNSKIAVIVSLVEEEYPNINRSELISILNSDDKISEDIFSRYGIDVQKESIIMENDRLFSRFIIIYNILFIGLALSIILLYLKHENDQDKEIKRIVKCIKEINKKNYAINIEDNTEDELSILKNEIYKTTVMLKEMAENSKDDKLRLKDSLSDISHQLKTPLTSINIMLDNILDNPNMDADTKEKFIQSIKREVTNISNLATEILKLSKFDANVVRFENKEVLVKDIIKKAISNVEMMAEIKNVEIKVVFHDNVKLVCDLNWQVEAIINILKNCIEHSSENSFINIEVIDNKIYKEIIIKDSGEGIDKKDLLHIFERFYKGKNSSKDSVGIGLALAKKIIEMNNGSISVNSVKGKGTIFTIRYY